MGRDLCDMSGTYDERFEDFVLANAMLPRHYPLSLQGNIYERLTASISCQLYDKDMVYDYDQLLTKKPRQARAEFAMHQDTGYWPTGTPDSRTATCSLAITDATRANGCIGFVPGSHKTSRLMPHRAKGDVDRSESHTLVLDLPAGMLVEYFEVPRGSLTVHDEWIVHGSGGNDSDTRRKTYIIAYRSRATVACERSIGFTHSHNDTVNGRTALELSTSSKHGGTATQLRERKNPCASSDTSHPSTDAACPCHQRANSLGTSVGTMAAKSLPATGTGSRKCPRGIHVLMVLRSAKPQDLMFCSRAVEDSREPSCAMNLSSREIISFHNDGFLCVDRPMIEAHAIRRMQSVYDALFAERSAHVDGLQFDLARTNEEGVAAALPQIINPALYALELRDYVLGTGDVVAKQLLGSSVRAEIYHAILKTAKGVEATPLH